MLQTENLLYALTQFIHNFGALAVVGGALAGFYLPSENLSAKRKFAWLVFAGWCAQIISGLVFGGISLYFYGETPDLHSVALIAFSIKLICATTGFGLVLFYITNANKWGEKALRRAWIVLTGVGVTALTAAAFLRWFS